MGRERIAFERIYGAGPMEQTSDTLADGVCGRQIEGTPHPLLASSTHAFPHPRLPGRAGPGAGRGAGRGSSRSAGRGRGQD